MTGIEIIGIWIGAFLTLCIFSFLYKDNPFYKFAEYLYVGVSAGYVMAIDYQNVLRPNLFDNLAKAGNTLLKTGKIISEWWYLVPCILGIMLLMRLIPKISWASRFTLAFIVGLGAGINIVYTMQAQVLKQIEATILPLWISGNFSQTLINWIIVIGVCCGLIYFYFSLPHKGIIFGGGAKVGVYVLMISFGAAFGYTVMARVSLLIGRLLFFKYEWWPSLQYLFK
ncbi:MAG: hypothetical protein HYU63_08955 [Armatimonadetes bacterium]|nr:hypothetical protein [Armatimonadota bacterium]